MEEMLLEIRNIAVEAATIIANPNWAAKWSLVMSALAIVVAGIVALRQNEIAKKQSDIADRQNKIALFEKRYEIYRLVLKCKTAALLLPSIYSESIDEMYEYLLVIFDKKSRDYLKHSEKYRVVVGMEDVLEKLDQAMFLFSKDVSEYIIRTTACLRILTIREYAERENSNFENIINNYCQSVIALQDNGIIDKIISEMKPQ